ncbi:MAG: right-handed parallel beta-helix repeat-containing protein [bacterium]
MHKKNLASFLFALSAIICFGFTARGAGEGASLVKQISGAKAGSIVTLPAGTFSMGEINVPTGVTLKGAGYDKTFIDATGKDFGVKLGNSANLSDVTITKAAQAGVWVEDVINTCIERVYIRYCGSGLLARNATECKASNLIIADCYSGVNFTRCISSSLTNATVANTGSSAIRVGNSTKVTVFNNIFVFAATGISVNGDNPGCAIDHNLYIANFVGQTDGEATRKKVEAWATLSGFDAHSLTIDFKFKDSINGDFRPISPLTWAPIRATSSDWGIEELNKVKAPLTDIDGSKRSGGIDLGAYEASFTAPRKADGTFNVKSGVGVTSAGLFTKDDRNMRYLFQNLPLAKGKYEYWLPSRDWQGRVIPAGDYQLKLTEAKLNFDYVAAAGNGDLQMSTTSLGSVKKRASLSVFSVAFDATGKLIVGQDGFESGQHVRAYDAAMSKFTWSYSGGGDVAGMTVDNKGRLLVMRRPANLLRLDAATGGKTDFSDGSSTHKYREGIKSVNGIAWYNNSLYLADTTANKLLILTGDDLNITGSVDLPGVTQPAVDTKTGLLWTICGKEIVAIDAAGTVKQRSAIVDTPTLLAANNGRLAAYSTITRKIHVFDSSDPAKLKPLFTIGTGDDGYGKIQDDRFWDPRAIAMSASGEIAVADPPRTCLFAADGSAKKLHMGMWGQGIAYGWFAGDDRAHFFNINGGYDITIDAKNNSWEPGTRWRYTMEMSPIFYFSTGGKNFGIFQQNVKDKGIFLVIAGMEPSGLGRALVRYGCDNNGMYAQRDTDGDGIIKDTDHIDPVLENDGKRIQGNIFNMMFNTDTRRDGSLALIIGNGMMYVPMTGLDAAGIPKYDFANRKNMGGQVEGTPNYISPYDFKYKESVSSGNDLFMMPDGGYVSCIRTASGPGPDPATEHSNGTSMAGFDNKGQLRWFSPMNPFGLKLGLHGITNINGITVAGRGQICEFETMDADGLGTGVIGTPRAFGWHGMWLDNHRQVEGFTGNDGKPYLIVGDYAEQSYHWMALTGYDKLIHQSLPVTISTEKAAALQAEPAVPLAICPVPPAPRVTIHKIAAALPIDGDMAKWRTLGITPIVMSADDPTDNSAVIRLGYVDDALFVQVIKFDNALTFHQSESGRHYQQDGIEFNIGTFWSGWKYNVTRLDWKNDIILRDRFFGESRLLAPEEAPRNIKILDNAIDVPERKLLEGATGADLSKCKVMVIEMKLGKAALAGLPANYDVSFKSGKTFLLGICINDNDVVGGDLFAPIGWPTGYGAFSRDDGLATAVIE